MPPYPRWSEGAVLAGAAAPPPPPQAGCGIPQRMKDFGKMRGRDAAKRWRELEVLIVDEISMASVALPLSARSYPLSHNGTTLGLTQSGFLVVASAELRGARR